MWGQGRRFQFRAIVGRGTIQNRQIVSSAQSAAGLDHAHQN